MIQSQREPWAGLLRAGVEGTELSGRAEMGGRTAELKLAVCEQLARIKLSRQAAGTFMGALSVFVGRRTNRTTLPRDNISRVVKRDWRSVKQLTDICL
jgi:hypothetical protein